MSIPPNHIVAYEERDFTLRLFWDFEVNTSQRDAWYAFLKENITVETLRDHLRAIFPQMDEECWEVYPYSTTEPNVWMRTDVDVIVSVRIPIREQDRINAKRGYPLKV